MYQRMNRSLEYALMALKYMSSRPGECISVKEMTQMLHCPFDPFSKVMQRLVDHKVVQSKKGIQGGYSFSGDLGNLSFYELMSFVLPSLDVADCISGPCELVDFCNIKTPMNYFQSEMEGFYKTLSVKNFLQGNLQKRVVKK